MAIVFISPKQRQKTFLVGIIITFSLFVIAVSFMVFLAKPEKVSQTLVFNKPKVTVDLKTLDSEVVKNLEPWVVIKTEYQYNAVKDSEVVEGRIAAESYAKAKKALEDLGFSVNSLEEVKIGRINPFEPY